MQISDLPTELIFQILSYLSKEDVFWGAGISCKRFFNIGLGLLPNIIEVPIRIKSTDISAYLYKNIFRWNEVKNSFTCILICDPDQDFQQIYESTKCVLKSHGLTLVFSYPSITCDVSISPILSNFCNLKKFLWCKYDWDDGINDFFVDIEGKYQNLSCVHISKATKLTNHSLINMTKKTQITMFTPL